MPKNNEKLEKHAYNLIRISEISVQMITEGNLRE